MGATADKNDIYGSRVRTLENDKLSETEIEVLVDLILSPPLVTQYAFSPVPERIASILGTKLGEKKSLTKLYLECLGRHEVLKSKDIELACQVLTSTSSLETLIFAGKFEDAKSSIALLSKAFEANTTLRNLEFGLSASVPDDCLAELLSGLIGHKTLESIIMPEIADCPKTVEQLAELLKARNCRLEKIGLVKWEERLARGGGDEWKEQYDFGEELESCTDISSMVVSLSAGNRSLRKLDTLGKEVSDKAMYLLAGALRSNTIVLEHLCLQSAIISSKAVKRLLASLEFNSTLSFLDISYVELDDEAMAILSKSLSKNQSLKTLRLESCSISNEGIETFATSMDSMTTLEELDIGLNKFDERGVDALNRGLRQNDSICSLHFPDQSGGDLVTLKYYNYTHGDPANDLLALNKMTKVDLSEASQTQLENVAGYLECQRRLGNLASKNDPNGELSSLNFHVDGLKYEQDGETFYKGEFRQQNILGETVQNLSELMEAATIAKKVYDALLISLVTDSDGIEMEGALMTCPLKKVDRIIEKANNDYSGRNPGPSVAWVNDVCRGTILCRTRQQMLDINEKLQAKRSKGEVSIVSAKNRFRNPTLSGYRDWLLVLRLPVVDGESDDTDTPPFYFNCELQVHHEEIWSENKVLHSHKYYEFFRENFAGNDSEAVSELIQQLGPVHESGHVDSSFIKSLVESKDVKRMRGLSAIFRTVLPEPNLALHLRREMLELESSLHGAKSWRNAETYVTIGDLWLMLDRDESTSNARSAFQSALEIYEVNKDRSSELQMVALKTRLARLAVGEVKDREDGDAEPNDEPKSENQSGDDIRLPGEVVSAMQAMDAAMSNASHGELELLLLKATMLSINGDAFRQLGAMDRALNCHSEALKIRKEVLDEFDSSVASSLCDLGLDKEKQNETSDAITYYSLSLEAYRRGLGEMHSRTARVYNLLGKAYKSEKNFDMAISCLKKSVEIMRAIGEKEVGDHSDLKTVYFALEGISATLFEIGKTYNEKGELELAEETFREVVSMEEKVWNFYDPNVRTPLGWQNFVMVKSALQKATKQ
mmetsp:Transcript_31208/g.75060  ORF Transcript_31208/g.75060 Transcript_31208/m.75060 type:complete len:1060 (-) Transcript_31208:100-3279(-)